MKSSGVRASSVSSSRAKAKDFANVVPPEFRAAMESAGVTLTTDPETGSTSFELNGFFLARVEVDPPAVVWGNASFGQYLHGLFEYHQFLIELGEAKGSARDLMLSHPKPPPNERTREAAGISVRWTGNWFTGKNPHFAHPALGEFCVFRGLSVDFSSPRVFAPLITLCELDTLFTPIPYDCEFEEIFISMVEAGVYVAHMTDVERASEKLGFKVGWWRVGRPKGHAGRFIRVHVELPDDFSRQLQPRSAAVRAVLAAFGPEPAVVRVQIDFVDQWGFCFDPADVDPVHVVIDTGGFTARMAKDDDVIDAYIASHTRTEEG